MILRGNQTIYFHICLSRPYTPPKVPQATEIFILPDRVSKTSMKDRLVIKGVIYILCKEKLVLHSYESGFCFSVEDCDVYNSKYYFIGRWGEVVHWCAHFLFLIASTNCLLKCFIQILFPTYNSAILRDGLLHWKVTLVVVFL